MDRDLLKYRFGRTLELKPSAYTFYNYDQTSKPAYTLCVCVADEVLETFSNQLYLYNNVYQLNSAGNRAEISEVINYKWSISGYVCCG